MIRRVKVRRRREKGRGLGRPQNRDKAHTSSSGVRRELPSTETFRPRTPLRLHSTGSASYLASKAQGLMISGVPSTKATPHASIAHVERSSSLTQVVSAKATAGPLTFEDLFADEHARLYRALYLIIGNTHEAEELMQDAFLHVLERWDRIDDPAGYLYRSALNSTRSRFRRLAFAAKRPLTPGQPEDPFAAADLRDQMVRSLRGLPDRQRAALVLVDLLDYRSEDAGKVLGITAATVRSLVSHGRAAMKLSLEVDDDG